MLGARMARQRRSVYVYTHRKVRKQGLRDGRDWRWKFWPPRWPFREPKDPQPPVSQTTHSEFERALKDVAEEHMQSLAEEWSDLDKQMKPTYCAALVQWQKAKARAEKAEPSRG